MKLLRWGAFFWVFCVGAAFADGPEQGIIVTGEGRVAMAPDMAMITLGVTETAETAGEVMEKVTGTVAGILDELDALGIAAQDRQTSGFYLQPVDNRRDVSGSQPPRITGYRAGNTVTVRVRGMEKLGEVMDAVIAIGANDFNGLRFGLQDDSGARAEARARAVADASLRATQLAEAAGLTLGNVVRMTESSHHAGPSPMQMAEARSVGDAIAGGEVGIVAQVTMVFSIAPDGQ